MCILCEEAVTNPICVGCLEKGMEQWAMGEKPVLVPMLRERLEIIRSFTHEGTRCVLCKENINICSHCFCKDVYDWLKAEHPESVNSFLLSFNYEIKSPCKFQ